MLPGLSDALFKEEMVDENDKVNPSPPLDKTRSHPKRKVPQAI